MRKLLVLAGVFLALITTVASHNQVQAGAQVGACRAPIIVSN